MPQRSASDGRVCFVWGIEHGDAFYKGFQWYGRALFGLLKKYIYIYKYIYRD